MLKTTTFYVFVLACACLSLIANAKYIHEGCQDLEIDENLAKASGITADADVVGQMRKQREERVECNLDCRLRQYMGSGDASVFPSYPLTFPYFVWAPGVMLLVCLVVFPCWMCCRCCSWCCRSYNCCCCFKPQKSKKYTKFQKSNVLGGYLLFSIPIAVCAIIGMASSYRFSSSMVETTCQFDYTRYSAKTIMDRVFSPARKINALIPSIISDVKKESEAAMAKRDGRLTSDAQKKLIDDMKKFHLYAAQVYQYKCGNPSINSQGNYSCKICALKHIQSVDDTIAKIDLLTKNPAENVKRDRETVTEYIIMAGSAIIGVVNQFTDGLQFVVNFLSEGGAWDTAGDWAIRTATVSRETWDFYVSRPVHYLLLACIALTFFGVCILFLSNIGAESSEKRSQKVFSCVGGHCIGFSWCLTCCLVLIFLLTSQLMWPLLFAMTDTCIILEKAPLDLSAYISLGEYESSMLQSCFDNVTVLPPGATSSDNSTGGLDFSSMVKFSSVKDVNEIDNILNTMFDWPWLDINETNMVNGMAVNLRRTNNSAGQCLNNRTNALFKLKDMFANITAEKKLFKKYFNISYRSMGKIQKITQPMFRVGDIMQEGFNCGEVGSAYFEMHGILCGKMLESISNLVTAWFLASCCGIITAYLSLKINQRWGGHGRPDHYETDNGSDDAGDFEMQENNYTLPNKGNFTSI